MDNEDTISFVLGAPDPEMEAIQEILRETGIAYFHAELDGTRVHAGNAYRANGIRHRPQSTHVAFVECAVEGVTPDFVCDHHRPGDPGFGAPPEDYWEASSIGQVVRLLFKFGERPNWPKHFFPVHMVAAADHCLRSAYQGECPGVFKLDLWNYRATVLAAAAGRTTPEQYTIMREAKAKLLAAPFIQLPDESLFRDCRGPAIDSLPEVACSCNESYIAGPFAQPDGRQKFTVSGTAEEVRAWMAWAPTQGLVDIYGDPARGFAGGYAS